MILCRNRIAWNGPFYMDIYYVAGYTKYSSPWWNVRELSTGHCKTYLVALLVGMEHLWNRNICGTETAYPSGASKFIRGYCLSLINWFFFKLITVPLSLIYLFVTCLYFCVDSRLLSRLSIFYLSFSRRNCVFMTIFIVKSVHTVLFLIYRL